MSTIPASAFAARLQALEHGALCAFVAALWSRGGWETHQDGSVVVVRKGATQRRLLVRPAGRLARFRADGPEGAVDRVVSPRIGARAPPALADVPVIDANALHRRLLYGLERDAAAELCSTHLDVPLAGARWERDAGGRSTAQLAVFGLAALLIISGIVVSLFGLPFLEPEPTAIEQPDALAEGFSVEIEPASPEVTADVSDGVAHGKTAYVTSANGTVTALDGDSGAHVWSTELGAVAGAPLVADGTVYVRATGTVYALDALTGETRWTDAEPASNVTTRPTVTDGSVYLVDGGTLVALDAETGERADGWLLAGESAPPRVDVPVTVVDGVAYTGGPDGVLRAVALDNDGENETDGLFWETSVQFEQFRSTVVPVAETGSNSETDGSLLVAGGRTLYSFEATTGERDWEFVVQPTGSLASPVVVTDGAAFDGGEVTEPTEARSYLTDSQTVVHALDPASGEQHWVYEDGRLSFSDVVAGWSANESGYSLYAAGGGVLGTPGGVLVALDPDSGAERWRHERESAVRTPTVAGTTLYAGTDDGELIALDIENATERWETDGEAGSVDSVATVTADPLGDSVDSHARLGLEGHHDWLAGEHTDEANGAGVATVDVAVPEQVAAEEALEATVTLANTGTETDRATVAFDASWETEETPTTETELEPGEMAELTLSLPAPAGPGEYSTEVRVDDERSEHRTAVLDRPTVEITGVDDPGVIWEGTDGEVIVSVTNSGEVDVTTPIGLEFDGEIVDATRETVEANETSAVTLSFTADAAVGESEYAVATADDAETATVELQAADERTDALPVVSQLFGLTLLVSGIGVGWWALGGRRSPLSNDSSYV